MNHERPWNIPSHWIWAKIGDLGDIVSGGTPSTKEPLFWGDEINWICPSDLTGYKDMYILKGAKGISQKGLINSSAKLMPAGSIHFSSRAPIGYVVISLNSIATNQGFKSLVPRDGISNKYVYYYLKSAKTLAEQRANGTTFKEISGKSFSQMPFPLPPFNEQKRIVTIIEELFSEFDKGVENLQKVQELLKIYRQSLFDSAATGELLVSSGILKTPFDDSYKTEFSKVLSEYAQGWSPKCLNKPSTNENDWAVIKTTAIQNNKFLQNENKLLPTNLKPKFHLEITPGDILITRAGPRNRVGIACLVRKCRKHLILCDKAYRIRTNKEIILPEYLEVLLNSPRIIDLIDGLKTGINDSGVNLTQERILALKLIIPPLPLQQLTLQMLQDRMSTANHISQQINIALEKIKSMRQSILKKAFSGELVPHNPSDEPAGIHLEQKKFKKIQKNSQNKKTKKSQKVFI